VLILARFEGDRVVIGDQIVVRVLSVDRTGKVRLGITAPKDVEVWRSELLPPTHPALQAEGGR
jgi:carbon storage regulator